MIPYYENRNTYFDAFSFHDISFIPHLHRHVEIMYAAEGELTVFSDGSEQELCQGGLFIAFPNTVHSYDTRKSSVGNLVLFEPFAVTDLNKKLTQYKPQCPFLAADQIHPEVLYVLNRLSRHRTDPINASLLKGYLLVMLGRLLERLTLRPHFNNGETDSLHRVLLYLNQNFLSPVSLTSTAKACALSKYHISHLISDKIGVSFNQYIGSLRIDYAKHLLSTTSLSVTEVGYESGFESQCTFYRTFKELAGSTPKEFRGQSARD